MEFLKSIDLDSILQQLVRDALDAKPDDALQFAADWTRKKLNQRSATASHNSSNASNIVVGGGRGGSPDESASGNNNNNTSKGGNSPLIQQVQSGVTSNSDEGGPSNSVRRTKSSENVLKSHSVSLNVKGDEASDLDVNDSASVVLYSWRARTATEEDTFLLDFCDLVLNVLFTAHPCLKILVLDELNLTENDVADNLAVFVGQIIYRKSTPQQIAKDIMKKWSRFSPTMTPQANILLRFRQRHFHYLLCSILYAAECIFTRTSWKQLGNDWLQVFGDVIETVQQAIFDEQIVTASLSSREALDSEFEQTMVLTTASLTRLSPVDTCKGVWLGMTSNQQEKICKKFFAVLFTQHKTVLRFFVDEDKETKEGDSLVDQAPVKELQVILTQVLRGFLSLEGISKMSLRHAQCLKDEVIPQRFLHYSLSCMLTALSIELGPKKMDTQISQAWRIVLTRILDAVGEGLEEAENSKSTNRENSSSSSGGGSSSHCSKNDEEGTRVSQQVDAALKVKMDDPNKLDHYSSGSPFSTAAECWTAMRDRQSAAEISETFFNILFTQHPALGKSLVKNNGELSELMAYLPSLFTEVVNCELSESDLREMGAKLTGRGLDEQKADHAVAAAMSVFAILLGITIFREREDDLNVVVRFITDNILFGIQNSQAVLAARAPEVIVNESWLAIIDKEAVIKKAVEVMKIQHRGLTRDLLDGVDPDAFAKLCVDAVSKILNPTTSESTLEEVMKNMIELLKAKCEEKQRPVDKKLITYFSFSFQSAVGIILGSTRFEQVSGHWTSQTEKHSKKMADLF